MKNSKLFSPGLNIALSSMGGFSPVVHTKVVKKYKRPGKVHPIKKSVADVVRMERAQAKRVRKGAKLESDWRACVTRNPCWRGV